MEVNRFLPAVLSICGLELLVYGIVSDTCVAMEEWVQHPYDHTALDDILPCVDPAMTAEVMSQSKNVTYQIIDMTNGIIANVSNRNFPPQAVPLYYNQSGPLVPVLCNPYLPDLSPRPCLTEELHFDNAIWKGYICETTNTSGSEICTTIGRLTPTFYYEMTSAVNVTYALYHYGPYLSDLADCTFVRQTFKSISDNSCRGLGQYSNQSNSAVNIKASSRYVLGRPVSYAVPVFQRRVKSGEGRRCPACPGALMGETMRGWS
ncbi:hypothetical protein LUZ61_011778 [Rhynchospora tenuis]|uniref:Uncharacterized protein n=1 Tax=Rhynchospora tenuis TaxID=198213 RepID=A0AAD6F0W1_9POAL|nr:hypothetical protein LUZ61_011778 [Rhynchospora tenuis]